MKILHIFPRQKFTEQYIEFINDYFDMKNHTFLIYGAFFEFKVTSRDNVIDISKTNFYVKIKLLFKLNKVDKIILHGLSSKKLVCLFLFKPWLLKKTYWVIWGKDLYYYEIRKKTLFTNIYEKFRAIVIKKFIGVITHVVGDYQNAVKWYNFKGQHFNCFMYPSNLYYNGQIRNYRKTCLRKTILVGNSGDPSNRHLDILKKLETFKNHDIEIICPLPRTSKIYRESVIKVGQSIFDKNFIALSEFLPIEDYNRILSRVDVAVFNHDRQKGMGNIINLLGQGKKVFINEKTTTWKLLEDLELCVYSFNKDLNILLDEMPETQILDNIEKIKKNFSKDKLKEDMAYIFNS